MKFKIQITDPGTAGFELIKEKCRIFDTNNGADCDHGTDWIIIDLINQRGADLLDAFDEMKGIDFSIKITPAEPREQLFMQGRQLGRVEHIMIVPTGSDAMLMAAALASHKHPEMLIMAMDDHLPGRSWTKKAPISEERQREFEKWVMGTWPQNPD